MSIKKGNRRRGVWRSRQPKVYSEAELRRQWAHYNEVRQYADVEPPGFWEIIREIGRWTSNKSLRPKLDVRIDSRPFVVRPVRLKVNYSKETFEKMKVLLDKGL